MVDSSMLVMEGPTMFGNYLIETVRTNYPSDVSDAEWALIRPFMHCDNGHKCVNGRKRLQQSVA